LQSLTQEVLTNQPRRCMHVSIDVSKSEQENERASESAYCFFYTFKDCKRTPLSFAARV